MEFVIITTISNIIQAIALIIIVVHIWDKEERDKIKE